MRLYLMRHGIAINREDPNCPPEPDRFLTGDGVEKTRAAAQGLLALGLEPEVYITSPFRRALQTAEITAEVLGHPRKQIRRSNALLPDGAPAELFKELARIRGAEVICFGHAPNLDDVIAHAVGTAAPFTALKKAGVAALEVDSLSKPHGILLWVYTSKALRLLAK